jgi:hypothetical protein
MDGWYSIVIAFAGTGKTTTLVQYADRRQHGYQRRRFLYLCYNRSVRAEAERRFTSNVDCRTTHSLCSRYLLHIHSSQKRVRWGGGVLGYEVLMLICCLVIVQCCAETSPMAWTIVTMARSPVIHYGVLTNCLVDPSPLIPNKRIISMIVMLPRMPVVNMATRKVRVITSFDLINLLKYSNQKANEVSQA